jgi:hypothetical protein
MTFDELKDKTANDCDQIAKMVTDLGKSVREGNIELFERFWIEGVTDEGDSKIQQIREMAVIRYLNRKESIR